MKVLDATELDPDETGRIIKSAVTPRPIAWVSTVSEDGIENLAPFSSYNYVSSSQPVVQFNPNVTKDTTRNILDTEEFAVNVVTEALLDKMDHSGVSIPLDESEFEFADIDRAECRQISPPRVKDAIITMECTLYDSIEVYDRMMVLGEVQYFHIPEEVLTDGKVDTRKIDTIGALGGPYYTISNIEYQRRY